MSNLSLKNNDSTNVLKWCVLLFLVSFLYSFSNIFEPQFINHTEADRALIGLEMLRRGNFVVPNLLGDIYLTKPPLFYWLVACAYYVFDCLNAWVPRFPSAIFCGLLTSAHYLFLVKAGWHNHLALLSTIILTSTPAIFLYSTNAEIDFVFMSICSLSLYLAYFVALPGASLLTSTLASIVCGLAVLTKGPQPVFLFFCGLLVFAFLERKTSPDQFSFWRYFVLRRLLEVGIISLVVGIWISFLISEVGINQIYYHFNVEVISRVVPSETLLHRFRSPFFYIGILIVATLPWSGFLVKLFSINRYTFAEEKESNSYNSVFKYSLSIVVPALIIFSIFPAKASRYITPLYPWVSCILTILLLKLEHTTFADHFKKVWGSISVLCLCGAFYILFELSGVISANYLIIGVVSLLTLFGFLAYVSFNNYSLRTYAVCFFVIFILCRLPYRTLYAEERNHKKSVALVVHELDQYVPKSKPIYILEMFERWIPYYLIQRGREVYRLTPEIATTLKSNENEKAFVLLNKEDENWRLDQLRKLNTQVEESLKMTIEDKEFLLISIDASKAYQFSPKMIFPTVKSEPYPGVS